jgi:proteasome accessory factor A
MRMLLGVETEYAVSGVADTGVSVDPGQLVGRMLEAARVSYPHLRDGGSGIFLANGARLYVDRGSHPEFATPECADPWSVVRYIRAGEALLLELAARIRQQTPGLREIAIYRHNVDYSRSGATWGCHESYLHASPPAQVHIQLLPHLVTRIIYAGAGGFNPRSHSSEFTLSPRAWMLSRVSSPDSTSERGLIHLKDEPLAQQGWKRLHLICGESLCSDLAAVLKLGTTALIVAATEAGRRPGDAVRLAAADISLHRVAADPDGLSGLRLQSGGQLSAREIQRHYLAEIESCRASQLPEWAGDLCRLWRTALDALDAGAPSLQHSLDWAIKRALYERWITRRMTLRAFREAAELFRMVERAAARLEPAEPGEFRESLAGARGLAELERLQPLLLARGGSWEQLREYFRLRHELLEAGTRFGQLGEHGIFTQLERAGVLRHDAGARTRAGTSGNGREQPPADTRARVRGEWIGRLWREGGSGRYRGDWSGLWDEVSGRMLDLSDPFAVTADWR